MSNENKNQKLKHKRAKWTENEDELVKIWVNAHGPKEWVKCSKELCFTKTNKQIRERWLYILNPNLKKESWNILEDYILFKLFKIYGSKWYLFPYFISGRTEISIKNRFYNIMRNYIHSSIFKILPEDIEFKVSLLNLSKSDILSYFEYVYKEKTSDIEEYLTNKENLSCNYIDTFLTTEMFNFDEFIKKINPLEINQYIVNKNKKRFFLIEKVESKSKESHIDY